MGTHAPVPTSAPRSTARSQNSRTSRVLPIPASPATRIVSDRPAMTASSDAPRYSNCSALPTSTGLELRWPTAAVSHVRAADVRVTTAMVSAGSTRGAQVGGRRHGWGARVGDRGRGCAVALAHGDPTNRERHDEQDPDGERDERTANPVPGGGDRGWCGDGGDSHVSSLP